MQPTVSRLYALLHSFLMLHQGFLLD